MVFNTSIDTIVDTSFKHIYQRNTSSNVQTPLKEP